MYIVRPVQNDDVDALFNLVQEAAYGLTTLKVSRTILADRVERSVYSFGQAHAKPEGQPYVFVMENTSNGRLVGTSTLYSKVGGFDPFYTYLIKAEHKVSSDPELDFHVDIQVPYLSLSKQHDGPTEIGSLYLARDCWGMGLGRLLSLSRFLFMAQFPARFENEVIAEMRGVVDDQGESPLWNALGKHFFQQSFPEAETLTQRSKKLIAQLMPKNEIYIPLLPAEAQNVIGAVHPNTRPALAMLEQEGFAFRQHVDIFDGGPAVHCETNKIRTVRDSREARIVSIADNVEGVAMLIANTDLDFRVSHANLRVVEANPDRNSVELDAVTALRLQVLVGDSIRFVRPKLEPKTSLEHSKNII
ncbi:MAG TPA: arginine N-succinyltransferase [Pirellulaceae bacterium]|nr:arginine N-succinyltransferase [Pirellulaceae bacterium]HMO91487.1 arginine N-succinyltransferase [Pirellulaceae bacterium]HMP70958.1 arginine N-succinyltransferase [Pirellulaceae bacterium]